MILAGGAVALALFAQAFVRLRRRGRADLAGADRALLYCLGVAVATVALISPLDAVAERSLLSAHMLQHVLIGDVAPALLVVALRGPLAFFLIPASALRVLARRRWLRRLLGFLLRPSVSFGVWVLAIALWHIPAAYELALAQPVAHDVEHISFMLAGLLVWTQLVDPAHRGALSRSGRLGFAVWLFAAGQVLVDVLVLSPARLYPTYTSLGDQRLAGLVMLGEQAIALGLCASFLAAAEVRGRDGRRARVVVPDRVGRA